MGARNEVARRAEDVARRSRDVSAREAAAQEREAAQRHRQARANDMAGTVAREGSDAAAHAKAVASRVQ